MRQRTCAAAGLVDRRVEVREKSTEIPRPDARIDYVTSRVAFPEPSIVFHLGDGSNSDQLTSVPRAIDKTERRD